MTAAATVPSVGRRLAASLRAERLTVFGTPAARVLLGASVVMAALSCAVTLTAGTALEDPETIRLAMHASTVATLVFSLVAGLYSATTDHRFGLVDHRLLGEPRRSSVFSAKALGAVMTGLAYGVAGAVTAGATVWAWFAWNGGAIDLSSPVVLRALVGLVFGCALYAPIGVAVGTMVRSQPMAIGGALAWLMIIEPVIVTGASQVGRVLPGAAGLAVTYSPDPALLGQVTGAWLLAAYALAAAVAAGLVFNRTDV
jgi:hypothetical protein